VAQQPQRRVINRCSVTRTPIGGRSNTCRRSIPACGAPPSSAPPPTHAVGSWHTVSSRSSTNCSVEPGCPWCRPVFRPLPRRNDRGAGLANGESVDGGFAEFRELIPSRRFSSAFSARSCAFSASSMSGRAVNRSTRPKLRDLRTELLVRGARIRWHPTMIRGCPQGSTRHSGPVTTIAKVTSATQARDDLTSYDFSGSEFDDSQVWPR
jgi:hypothetical protein